ncbi:Glutathione peroxidase 3 [Mizuhopecten yessoensis]|uniref:Glutathione peroxidase n=1 Tax=Mizuhopecten yessoensis TaxID=6573 RepID=A0A210QH86_MIZYE|nr:Glutathione peroxidase 3 [Mizuhopecten yessoensis]
MNALQTELEPDGLHVLGVPCNQFNGEEPGANGTEIMDGIEYVRPGNGFRPAFNLTEKIDVNGENQHPLYGYMKEFCPTTDHYYRSYTHYAPFAINDVHWNFEKFLVGRDGRVVSRYHPKVEPGDIRADISKALHTGVILVG